MKKYFRIMLASILALTMVLSLASCLKKDDDKDGSSIDMDDIVDVAEDYADDNNLELADIKLFVGKKPIEKGLETFMELDGDVESCYEISSTQADSKSVWCLIIEFEETADAKSAAKGIENNLEEFYYVMLYETSKAIYGSMFEDEIIQNTVESDSRNSAKEAIPSAFIVERIENVIFFGDKNIVDDVFEAVEEEIKDEK